MEELAEKLNVPLDSIDEQTRLLLENLTKQLGLVARQQAGPLGDSSMPPELRDQRQELPRTMLPPELREQHNVTSSSVPPELRSQQATIPLDHMGDNVKRKVPVQAQTQHGSGYSRDNATGDTRPSLLSKPDDGALSRSMDDSTDDYCTSYPPPDMEEEETASISSSQTLTVDYSHGKRANDTVTSESILASLQTDLTSASGRSNGEQPKLSTRNMPSMDKVQKFTHNVRMEMGNRPVGPGKSGNGFIPRQLQSRPGNVLDRPVRPVRPELNRPRLLQPNMGPRQRPPRHPQPGQSRKW